MQLILPMWGPKVALQGGKGRLGFAVSDRVFGHRTTSPAV